jgi:hypothetical protein
MAEEERDQLSKDLYDATERASIAETVQTRESQLRREAERNFEKERMDNKMLRQRLVDARADVQVEELSHQCEELKGKLETAYEEMHIAQVKRTYMSLSILILNLILLTSFCDIHNRLQAQER